MRRAGSFHEDTVAGDAWLPPLAFRLTGIRVDVEMRKVAARYVEPKPVAAAEQIGDRKQFNRYRIDLARLASAVVVEIRG